MDDPKIIISLFAFFLALTAFCVSVWQSWKSGVISRKPILVIEYTGDTGWHLRNIGNGPALNILIAQKRVGISGSEAWFNPVRIPPLGKRGTFHMKWLGHVNTTGIGAVYEDFRGKTYSSTCGNDLVKLYVGNQLASWQEQEIGRHWNHPSYEE